VRNPIHWELNPYRRIHADLSGERVVACSDPLHGWTRGVTEVARKRTLGRVIEEWIAANHTTSTALAQLLGVNPDSFRLWVKKNSFPAELIGPLGEQLNMETDPDELGKRLSFGLNEKRGPTARIVSTQPDVAAVSGAGASGWEGGDFLDSWIRMLRECRRADFVTWVGLDSLPPELDGRSWPRVAEALVGAVRRGVDVLYLHAGPAGPEGDVATGDGAELRTRAVGREPWDWTSELITLRENLRSELRRSGVEALEADRCVRAHVIEVALGPTSFMTPGHLYASVRHFDDEVGTYVPRGFCVLPHPQGTHMLELGRPAADPLAAFVARVVDAYLPERREIAHRIRPPESPTPLKVVAPGR